MAYYPQPQVMVTDGYIKPMNYTIDIKPELPISLAIQKFDVVLSVKAPERIILVVGGGRS